MLGISKKNCKVSKKSVCAHERINHYMSNSEKKDFPIPPMAVQTTRHISKLSETGNEAITNTICNVRSNMY